VDSEDVHQQDWWAPSNDADEEFLVPIMISRMVLVWLLSTRIVSDSDTSCMS
jgi:hypothetical protein